MSTERARLQEQIEELEAEGIIAEVSGNQARAREIYAKLARLYAQQDRLKD